jgi:nicotinate-nucleotide pyrophosphorylase (carboxylating)
MQKPIAEFIKQALKEDLGEGDHTSLACIPEQANGKAHLLVKEEGVIAGIDLAEQIYLLFDNSISFERLLKDGDYIKKGDTAFIVEGNAQSILMTERLILNCMQRMSGIASNTNRLVKLIEGTKAKLLDTRKTTPGFRMMEKWAVKIGGGHNHRFGLYDMIMIKDNHIDYAGGIRKAILSVNEYLEKKNLDLKIEIEARNFEELNEILAVGMVNRIMLDNFTPSDLKKAIETINGRYETEASGGINEDSIRSYAETGVDYISVGALTHNIKSLDLSLKAIR